MVGLTGHDALMVRAVAASTLGLGLLFDDRGAREFGAIAEGLDPWHDKHFASYHWLLVSALRCGSWQVTQPRDPSLSV